jgi:hypothetical protein
VTTPAGKVTTLRVARAVRRGRNQGGGGFDQELELLILFNGPFQNAMERPLG